MFMWLVGYLGLRRLSYLLCLVGALVAVSSLVHAGSFHVLLNKKQLALAVAHYGPSVKEQLLRWADVLQAGKQHEEFRRLNIINDYFNGQVSFKSDEHHWQKEDYWATPLELLGTTQGDCEDYVIAKYFSLIHMGVPSEKLRIMYVKALYLDQAHMVLAYYPSEQEEPWILDNLISSIQKASNREDLEPVYSFNHHDLWLEKKRNGAIKIGSPNSLNMWTDLLLRMQQQGLGHLLEQPKR